MPDFMQNICCALQIESGGEVNCKCMEKTTTNALLGNALSVK